MQNRIFFFFFGKSLLDPLKIVLLFNNNCEYRFEVQMKPCSLGVPPTGPAQPNSTMLGNMFVNAKLYTNICVTEQSTKYNMRRISERFSTNNEMLF